MSLSRITTILLWLLMGISAVLVVIFYAGPVVDGTKGTGIEEPNVTDLILNWAYFLIGIAAVISIVFPLLGIVTNPKDAKKSLIGLAFAVIIVFIAYELSSDEVLRIVGYDGTDNVPTTLKWVDTGLYSMYILFIVALGTILFSEIARLFK